MMDLGKRSELVVHLDIAKEFDGGAVSDEIKPGAVRRGIGVPKRSRQNMKAQARKSKQSSTQNIEVIILTDSEEDGKPEASPSTGKESRAGAPPSWKEGQGGASSSGQEGHSTAVLSGTEGHGEAFPAGKEDQGEASPSRKEAHGGPLLGGEEGQSGARPSWNLELGQAGASLRSNEGQGGAFLSGEEGHGGAFLGGNEGQGEDFPSESLKTAVLALKALLEGDQDGVSSSGNGHELNNNNRAAADLPYITKINRICTYRVTNQGGKVLIYFLVTRSDNKVVEVDNQFMRKNYPDMLIDFYERHLRPD